MKKEKNVYVLMGNVILTLADKEKPVPKIQHIFFYIRQQDTSTDGLLG